MIYPMYIWSFHNSDSVWCTNLTFTYSYYHGLNTWANFNVYTTTEINYLYPVFGLPSIITESIYKAV